MSRLFRHTLLGAAVLLCVDASRASATCLVFGSCMYEFQPLVQNAYSVIVVGSPVGISTVEFRIDGVDPTWVTVVTPGPTVTSVTGDPLGAGCVVTLTSCEFGDIPIFSITSLPTATVTPHVLRILGLATPTDPQFACPNVILCNGPMPGRVCLPGGCATVNGGGGSCCSVDATQSLSWSRVQSLFRD